MSGTIKCSYKSCSQRFNTVEAMKKHKARDGTHDSYCKKCDCDCNDDLEFLLHQLSSEKHTACPMCGREFKSEGGRDRHVEVEHIPKQNLECMGCHQKFDRASSLMKHFEMDECTVIKSLDFHLKKVERQITEDVWAAALDPTAGTTILSNRGILTGVDNVEALLDGETASNNQNWARMVQEDSDSEKHEEFVSSLNHKLNALSVTSFPAVGAPSSSKQGPTSSNFASPSTFLRPYDQRADNVWEIGSNATSQTDAETIHIDIDDDIRSTHSSLNLLNSFTDDDLNPSAPSQLTDITNQTPSSIAAQASFTSRSPQTHTSKAPTHLLNTPQAPLPISTFFSPVTGNYICPTPSCTRSFATPTLFRTHLLHPPHANSTTQAPGLSSSTTCPGCYKRFKSTTALMAHAESSYKCKVRESLDFDRIVRRETAGFVGSHGVTADGGVRFVVEPELGEGQAVVERRHKKEARVESTWW